MAHPKRKKNPKVVMRASDLRRTRRQDIDAAYRMFMAVALTTFLDKYTEGGEVKDYLDDMNKLVDSVISGSVSVDDLANVLEDEYDLRLDYHVCK